MNLFEQRKKQMTWMLGMLYRLGLKPDYWKYNAVSVSDYARKYGNNK